MGLRPAARGVEQWAGFALHSTRYARVGRIEWCICRSMYLCSGRVVEAHVHHKQRALSAGK